jgi:hypothetical protein
MSQMRRSKPAEIVSERKAILDFLHDIKPEVKALDAVAAYLLNVCIERIARAPTRTAERNATVRERPGKGHA